MKLEQPTLPAGKRRESMGDYGPSMIGGTPSETGSFWSHDMVSYWLERYDTMYRMKLEQELEMGPEESTPPAAKKKKSKEWYPPSLSEEGTPSETERSDQLLMKRHAGLIAPSSGYDTMSEAPSQKELVETGSAAKKSKSTATIMAMKEPVCLIESDSDGRLRVLPSAQRILEQIEQNVVVVSVVGLYRTGKSYLMNKLAGTNKVDVMAANSHLSSYSWSPAKVFDWLLKRTPGRIVSSSGYDNLSEAPNQKESEVMKLEQPTKSVNVQLKNIERLENIKLWKILLEFIIGKMQKQITQFQWSLVF